MLPKPDEQIKFLVALQRLLDEGLFVSSYKFALLLSLADLSVEKGDDSGATLQISTQEIGGKFIRYYWRQAVPFASAADSRVLRQNTGKQAAIINLVQAARGAHGNSIPAITSRVAVWNKLVRDVAGVVSAMPLWKLQTIGSEQLDFLYGTTARGNAIELRLGVAYCFRKFHALIVDLVRGAWGRFVRRQNLEALGEGADLDEFLFGSERTNLAAARPVLMEVQRGRCFYCGGSLSNANCQVDHFIAWARFPMDLGHNFVLADSRCNGKKRDRLAAYPHLESWVERNEAFGSQLASAFKEQGILSGLVASNRVVSWAYAQAESVEALTWVRADEMMPLQANWRSLLAYRAEDLAF